MHCLHKVLRKGTLPAMLMLVLGLFGNVSAQGTCLNVEPESLTFYGDICNGWLYQESIEPQPIYIQALCGDTGYYWEITADQPWVAVVPMSGWDSDSATVYIDKEHLINIVPDSLPPGDTLVLEGTVTVTGDELSPPEMVLVRLYLTCTSPQNEMQADPSEFYFSLPPGGVAAESLFVYEVHGHSIGFWIYNAAEWLYVDTMSAVPLFTPELLWIEVNAGSLPPGHYSDTIFIFSSNADNTPLSVPVNLEVTGGGEYTVQTFPTHYNLILSQGEGATDSLHVYEVNGHQVPLYFYNMEPWLVVDPFPMPPYTTPFTAVVTFATYNLTPGTYVDTIVIYPLEPDYPFDTVRVPVTVTIYGGTTLVASPDHFEFTVAPGEVVAHQGFFVYETHGDSVVFGAEVVGESEWLDLEQVNPYDLYWAPDSVHFGIYASDLTPGYYADTIRLYAPFDSISFPDVTVPVFLHVDSGGLEYIVDALPDEFNVTLAPGESYYDSLYVWEIYGHNVPFQIYNTEPWLVVDPFPMPPYVTPMSFVVAIGTNNIPPGYYSDTIVIAPVNPDYYFDTVLVPVSLTVDSSEYVLVVEPTEFDYSVSMGHFFYDYLEIDELHGQTLLLDFFNTQPWLSIPMFFVPPPTPMTLEFGVSTDSLLPGVYYDVITIIGYADPNQPAVAEAHVPVVLTVIEGQPFEVRAYPDHFEYTLHQGSHFITDQFLVYDLDSANLTFAVTQVNGSDWLEIDTSTMGGVTPSNVIFYVSTDGLEPGTYGDTVLIWYPLDDMYGFDDVLVPVILHILSDTLDAIVATEPESFEFVVLQGETHYDELHIYEIHGGTVPFHMGHQAPWLNLGTWDPNQLVTPYTSPIIVWTDSLPVGTYYDVISIWPDTDGVSFPPVSVPVTLTVVPNGPGPADSLILPSLLVTPCDWECTAQPVQSKLSQPIKGATIPIAVPEGVTICSLSTEGLVTQDWDWNIREVNDSLGFVFMALANSFDAQIPPGVTTLFNIYFYATPLCRDYWEFRWDTTLMSDPSKHLAYTDTAYNTVNPGFDKFRDRVEVRGYEPGSFDGEPVISISDLVATVDYMFRYGPPPCVLNALDVNGDCLGPDISDMVALIDWMFMPNDPPPEFPPVLECGCLTRGDAVAKLNRDITLTLVPDDGATTLRLSSPMDLRGLQLELRTAGEPVTEKLVGEQLDMVVGKNDGRLRVGILDLDGAGVIAAGETPLVRLHGNVEVVEAVVTDGHYQSMRVYLNGTGGAMPAGYHLSQNYPNPFNPLTEISLRLPSNSRVSLEVFNIMGQKVATLYEGSLVAGEHQFSWDASGIATGVYFYKLTTTEVSATRKMLLLK